PSGAVRTPTTYHRFTQWQVAVVVCRQDTTATRKRFCENTCEFSGKTVLNDAMRFAESLKQGGFCVLVASLVVSGFFTFSSNARAQQIGAPAPAWSLLDADGRPISSANFAGKVVLLSFFTTWCNPCLVEAPELAALQSEYGSAGLAVVGIGVYED